MNSKILAVFLIFISNRLCQCRLYTDYSLYSVIPSEPYQLKFLKNLEKQNYIDIKFWKKPHKLCEEIQFIVSPQDKGLFLERAQHFRMNWTLQMRDVQEAFDSQKIKKYHWLQVESYKWDSYHTLDDIYQWLSDMTLKYPSLIELDTIGKSVEGRSIYAVGIKRPGATANVMIEGGVHGNEWISTEVVMYLLNQLINVNATKNNDVHFGNIVNLYNWYLVPVVNPDGYEYSMKQDRLWRKNRRNIESGYGVDLNRNFNYSFGKHGTSTDTVDDEYCGPSPFSEPETKALAEYVMKKRDKLRFFFSFHSYGQKIIIPYADRIMHVENYKDMENYGKQAILKMYKLNGVKYSIGTTYDTLGFRISGNSASWVKKNFKVKYVFTFLLRDSGTYGYALPSNQILPTCEEAMTGLLEIMTARFRRLGSNDMFIIRSGGHRTAIVSFYLIIYSITQFLIVIITLFV